jgi:hypothetical protein
MTIAFAAPIGVGLLGGALNGGRGVRPRQLPPRALDQPVA